ncbi:MAG: hypothetical protein JWQ89_3659 [Devosia sp.]|uniref:DUF2076 domain-containing protein n=1 Tax=Devosia sp. TaxID=1871048 RepID=UPI002603872F|nr:DUF2076 domain-containing protein [Devosia sp.]MDB5541932.1 hypothetical protein [Devosia sp.]
MLNPEDRRAIEGLFDRLSEAERRNPDRDQEAQELIDREIASHPAAPYYMAQTIVVQQQALEAAEQRIQELEQQAETRGRGGLFGGLFDDGRGRQNRPDDRQPVQPSRGGPWDRPQDGGYNAGYQRGGGGFLAGAAQTAVGVAGGVLLGSAIGSLLGAGGAHASEANDQQANDTNDQQDQGNDQGQDQGQGQGQGQDQGNDPGNDGGDWGGGGEDGGGFDTGGDF